MEILKWNKKDDIFDGYIASVYGDKPHCDVYYIVGQGYCVLNKAPKYALYKRLSIPEIQDVYIMPKCRRNGLASNLIQHCEKVCGRDMIGISVPIVGDFGAAQCLYNKLGYQPDGNGVTYDRDAVRLNDHVKVDDNLCLMLIKHL